MSGRRRNSKTVPKRSGGGVFVGIIIGLMLGAVFAASVAWYLTRANPFADNGAQPENADGKTVLSPRTLPGKPGGPPVEKPQFDFYKILPKGDGSVDVSPQQNTQGVESGPSERLYLQVGAFEDPTEADNLKARLALMGIEASVQRGESATKGTVHRVRLGPYARVEDMNAMRAELARAGIDVALVRVRP